MIAFEALVPKPRKAEIPTGNNSRVPASCDTFVQRGTTRLSFPDIKHQRRTNRAKKVKIQSPSSVRHHPEVWNRQLLKLEKQLHPDARSALTQGTTDVPLSIAWVATLCPLGRTANSTAVNVSYSALLRYKSFIYVTFAPVTPWTVGLLCYESPF